LNDIDPRYIDLPDEPFSQAVGNTWSNRSSASSFSTQRERFVQPETRLKKLDSPEDGESRKVDALAGFRVGETVRHDRFGKGEIRSLEGSEGDAKATIQFELFGSKTLLLKYARLTVLKE
jgi:DNA helicase-2/ATP-dependent DNA helicase PcrA